MTRAHSPVLNARAVLGARVAGVAARAGCTSMDSRGLATHRWIDVLPQCHRARVGLQHLWTRRYSFATAKYDSAFGGQDLAAFALLRACRASLR
jgi:hypothetical protein